MPWGIVSGVYGARCEVLEGRIDNEQAPATRYRRPAFRGRMPPGRHEMSRTVILPDSVYERLEAAARDRGLESIEQLLEQWPLHAMEYSPLSEEELRQRQQLGDEIDAIREEA